MAIKNLSPYTFISIGENCLFQDVIRRYHFKTAFSPFSWTRSNIDYVIQIVEEDFIDLLSPNFLTYREMWGRALATNIKYTCRSGIYEKSVCNGFEFTHQDVINSKDAWESTQRKIKRFQEIVLNPTEKLVLTYHYRLVPNEMRDVQYIIKRLNELRNLISKRRDGDAPHVLLALQNLIGAHEQRDMCLEVLDGIYVGTFYTLTPWSGKDDYVFGIVDDDLFQKCFSQLEERLSKT